MNIARIWSSVAALLALVPGGGLAMALAATDLPLADGFDNPPPAARPRVWWHWMNGNVSKEGIRLDLEWLKRVGIGGVQTFDANLGTPQVVDRRLVFMTPEWRDAFGYAAGLANSLGLEMAIASSPGWSETGGPWVKPEQGMKKLVWSETFVSGGQSRPHLASPPDVAGPYQDIAGMGRADRYYADVRTVAYSLPPDAMPGKGASLPAVSTSASADAGLLTDGKADRFLNLPYGPDGTAWIRFDYHSPQRMRAVSVVIPGGRGFGSPPAPRAWLEASDSTGAFHRVVELPESAAQTRTVSFAPTQSRSFRIVLERVAGPRLGQNEGAPGATRTTFPPLPEAFSVAELTLYRQARVSHYDEKAGFGAAMDYYALASPPTDRGSEIAHSGVLDLTSLLRADDTLDWTVPPGQWAILRFGYSLTGHTNGPASPEATGLEVDKLNAAHVRSYLNNYLDMYAGAAGPGLLGAHGVTALLNDSIESGPQNWTEDMLGQFKRLRGYDLMPWLPVLTGVIVDDPATSDRVLWDFRRTIAELVTESHYHTIAEVAREHGLAVYGEALEDRRPQLGDDLAMRRYASIPMAAMWMADPGKPPRIDYLADDVGAASVAHVYGQNLVAAESLTSSTQPWYHTPRDLKSTVDLEFAHGINRIVIHTSVHQPLVDKRPGLALAVTLGQYFNRNETWAEMADAWVSYLARSSYLLQQGRYGADVAYFIGEEAPLTALFHDGLPTDKPTHHGVDFVNADVVREQLAVRDGKLVTPSGMHYRVLYLGGSSRFMTLATLRRLAALVRDGAVLVGERPAASPSAADDRRAFDTLAGSLWLDARRQGGARVGAGRVMAGVLAEDALRILGVPRDFDYGGHDEILTVHREFAAGSLYYVNNRSGQAATVDAAFRVTGFAPELWRADTGDRVPVGFRDDGQLTHVQLALAPHDALFVVFQQRTSEESRATVRYAEHVVAEVGGRWKLAFEAALGAPEQPIDLQSLAPWNESADARIRYFSGVGSYRGTLQSPVAPLPAGARTVLDLGTVDDLAEVWLNGRRVGVAWHAPYRVDVTTALRAGSNDLEIRVANRWVNRLIGDAQPGASRITVTQGPAYEASAPLVPSGLVGPVRLLEIEPQR